MRADPRPRRGSVLNLIVYSPDSPPRKVVEIAEPQLGHLELFDDGELLGHVVIRPFTGANEVEIAVADPRSWAWLSRVRVPTSSTAT
jgi:hypothetical protein